MSDISLSQAKEDDWPDCRRLKLPELKERLHSHGIEFDEKSPRYALVKLYQFHKNARAKGKSVSRGASKNLKPPTNHPGQSALGTAVKSTRKTKTPLTGAAEVTPSHPVKTPRGHQKLIDAWPSSAKLTIPKLKLILSKHQVSFGSRDKRATLVKLYENLRADSLRDGDGTKNPTKKVVRRPVDRERPDNTNPNETVPPGNTDPTPRLRKRRAKNHDSKDGARNVDEENHATLPAVADDGVFPNKRARIVSPSRPPPVCALRDNDPVPPLMSDGQLMPHLNSTNTDAPTTAVDLPHRLEPNSTPSQTAPNGQKAPDGQTAPDGENDLIELGHNDELSNHLIPALLAHRGGDNGEGKSFPNEPNYPLSNVPKPRPDLEGDLTQSQTAPHGENDLIDFSQVNNDLSNHTGESLPNESDPISNFPEPRLHLETNLTRSQTDGGTGESLPNESDPISNVPEPRLHLETNLTRSQTAPHGENDLIDFNQSNDHLSNHPSPHLEQIDGDSSRSEHDPDMPAPAQSRSKKRVEDDVDDQSHDLDGANDVVQEEPASALLAQNDKVFPNKRPRTDPPPGFPPLRPRPVWYVERRTLNKSSSDNTTVPPLIFPHSTFEFTQRLTRLEVETSTVVEPPLLDETSTVVESPLLDETSRVVEPPLLDTNVARSRSQTAEGEINLIDFGEDDLSNNPQAHRANDGAVESLSNEVPVHQPHQPAAFATTFSVVNAETGSQLPPASIHCPNRTTSSQPHVPPSEPFTRTGAQSPQAAASIVCSTLSQPAHAHQLPTSAIAQHCPLVPSNLATELASLVGDPTALEVGSHTTQNLAQLLDDTESTSDFEESCLIPQTLINTLVVPSTPSAAPNLTQSLDRSTSLPELGPDRELTHNHLQYPPLPDSPPANDDELSLTSAPDQLELLLSPKPGREGPSTSLEPREKHSSPPHQGLITSTETEDAQGRSGAKHNQETYPPLPDSPPNDSEVSQSSAPGQLGLAKPGQGPSTLLGPYKEHSSLPHQELITSTETEDVQGHSDANHNQDIYPPLPDSPPNNSEISQSSAPDQLGLPKPVQGPSTLLEPYKGHSSLPLQELTTSPDTTDVQGRSDPNHIPLPVSSSVKRPINAQEGSPNGNHPPKRSRPSDRREPASDRREPAKKTSDARRARLASKKRIVVSSDEDEETSINFCPNIDQSSRLRTTRGVESSAVPIVADLPHSPTPPPPASAVPIVADLPHSPTPPPPASSTIQAHEWGDPNDMTMKQIKEIFIKFGVKWKARDRKADLVNQYVVLAAAERAKSQELTRRLRTRRVQTTSSCPIKASSERSSGAQDPPNCLGSTSNRLPEQRTRPATAPSSIPEITPSLTTGKTPLPPRRRNGSSEILLPSSTSSCNENLRSRNENSHLPLFTCSPNRHESPNGNLREACQDTDTAMSDLIDFSADCDLDPPQVAEANPPITHSNRQRTLPRLSEFRTPLPRPGVDDWAAGVLGAIDDMDVDRKDLENLSGVQAKALMTALKSFTISHEKSAASMGHIAEAFRSISSSIQGKSDLQFPKASVFASSSRSRKVSHYHESEDGSDLETPIRKRKTIVPRAGPIPEAIRQHVATLFGRCAYDGDFPPPPAPLEERKNWVNRVEEQCKSDDEIESVDDDSVENMDLDVDPRFPYPDGPGHPGASPQALKIIWRMMRQSGVQSFRPNLDVGMYTTPGNAFLWDLALKTFMRLVDCGEYEKVTRELCSESKAKKLMDSHVTDHIMRIVREQRTMSVEQKAVRDKRRRSNTRRAKLCNWRLDEVMMHGEQLAPLIKVVQACCSDDESDEEPLEEPDESATFSNQAPARASKSKRTREPKKCVILRVDWRHPRVTRIFMELDRIRATRIEDSETKSNAPPPRTRRRVENENAKSSRLAYVKGLPITAYNAEWMRTLTPYELEDLGATAQPPLQHFIPLLQSL